MSKLISETSDTQLLLGRLRSEAAHILSNYHSSQADRYVAIVNQFLDLNGPRDDMLVRIGVQMFGISIDISSKKDTVSSIASECCVPGSRRIDILYLKSFMIECFLSVGVPEKEAAICSDVLIEADIQGIDSHGIGRLKV